MRLAETRLSAVKPSLTLGMDARARALKTAGQPIINLTAGQPDFPTPAHIVEAAARAMRGGQTRYTDVAGTSELRAAIAATASTRAGYTMAPENVLVSAGVKHALSNVLMAVVGAGDEVIVPVPVWGTYAEQARLAGATVIAMRLSPESGYRIDAEQVAALVTPRTRAVIVASPANPTGAVQSPDALRALALVAARHDLVILSDEIYDRVVYPPAVCQSVAAAASEAADRTIVFNGVSKTYAMTGWRLGWAIGPRAVIAAAARIQEQVSGNASSISQAGALAALTGPDEPIRRMIDAFGVRRKLALEAIERWPGASVLPPDGAFYLFPRIRWPEAALASGGWPGGAMGLAEYLLETAHVAVVPGEAFGAPEHIRISYAAEERDVVAGLRRIGDTLTQMNNGDIACRPTTTSA
jgi:aspartate aminotransferase